MPSQSADSQTQLISRVSESVHLLDVAWSKERAQRIQAGVWSRHRAQQRRRSQLRVAGGLGVILAALLLPRLWSTLPETRAHLFGRGTGSTTGVAQGGALRSEPSSERSAAATLSERERKLEGSTPRRVPADRESLSPTALRLADGSLASPAKNSAVAVRQESASRVVVELLHGSAEFAVTKNPGRLFRVEASGVAVEVLGTRFVVDKQPVSDGFRVAVTVSEGRVRVLFSTQQAQLAAGERAEFQVPRDAIAPASPEPPVAIMGSRAPGLPSKSGVASSGRAIAAEPPALASAGPVSASPEKPPRWKQLASEGRYEQAYEQIFSQAQSPSPGGVRKTDAGLILSPLATASHSAADLLLLADVARLSHHPAAAVSSLRQLLDGHGDDPRAPLAAFTLGRVLLDDLGQPREAAESFRKTQALDGDGPMAQDALAREVEAWSRAGDRTRCRERADEYMRRYPSGRRLQAVRHYAGLDSPTP